MCLEWLAEELYVEKRHRKVAPSTYVVLPSFVKVSKFKEKDLYSISFVKDLHPVLCEYLLRVTSLTQISLCLRQHGVDTYMLGYVERYYWSTTCTIAELDFLAIESTSYGP